MAWLQCPKRVHLAARQPELARYSKRSQAAFALGHEVGDFAVRLYGRGEGSIVNYRGGGFRQALRQTELLMTSMFRGPVFEATLEHDGVLVREDVLLPDDADKRKSWRVVEVKASTKIKPEHVEDCAVQAWVHRESGHPLTRISVAHVNGNFVYPGQQDYEGLLLEKDLSAEVFALLPSVPEWVRGAREAVSGPVPDVPVGSHCTNPYECPFMHHCWPHDSEYPLTGLGGSKKQLGIWVMRGYRDIRDVPASEIPDETRQRIHRVTCRGVPEVLPGARRFAEELPYPRYYLDFETIAPAVPLWGGTRPYQTLPFQWSCHIEKEDGSLDHREFLDLSGEPPMRGLAESLIEAVDGTGPILTYTDFELRVIRGLLAMFPDLEPMLDAITRRLVDLHPVTRTNYYHPDMLGSWSIKAVLPTIAPEMDYAVSGEISEGTEASAAYLEAIAPQVRPDRRESLRRELLRYCRHDTEAMVRLMHFFADA